MQATETATVEPLVPSGGRLASSVECTTNARDSHVEPRGEEEWNERRSHRDWSMVP